jgi:hypothetical protein
MAPPKRLSHDKQGYSKYRGVYRHEKHTWNATVAGRDGKTYRGAFDDELSAAAAYNHYARIHHGEFAVLNAVPDSLDWESHRIKRRSSSYKGVYWYKQSGRWRAQLHCGTKTMHLGLFECEEEAARAYQEAVARLANSQKATA